MKYEDLEKQGIIIIVIISIITFVAYIGGILLSYKHLIDMAIIVYTIIGMFLLMYNWDAKK